MTGFFEEYGQELSADKIKCLVHGLEHFGGIQEKVLFDRMKAVVLDVDSQKNPI